MAQVVWVVARRGTRETVSNPTRAKENTRTNRSPRTSCRATTCGPERRAISRDIGFKAQVSMPCSIRFARRAWQRVALESWQIRGSLSQNETAEIAVRTSATSKKRASSELKLAAMARCLSAPGVGVCIWTGHLPGCEMVGPTQPLICSPETAPCSCTFIRNIGFEHMQ